MSTASPQGTWADGRTESCQSPGYLVLSRYTPIKIIYLCRIFPGCKLMDVYSSLRETCERKHGTYNIPDKQVHQARFLSHVSRRLNLNLLADGVYKKLNYLDLHKWSAHSPEYPYQSSGLSQ